MDKETDILRVERRDRIAILTLNRPEALNAIGTATTERLAAELDRLRADDQVRALVIAATSPSPSVPPTTPTPSGPPRPPARSRPR